MRPSFPKRAIVTGGMPYGEKGLFFHHLGGYYIHADVYARFLRDRLGRDNVIFVSGTDCYGAGPEVKYAQLKQEGYEGTIQDFIHSNHVIQKEGLNAYGISLNLYAASAFGDAAPVHEEMSDYIFNSLYEHGYLRCDTTMQFFDEETQKVLNGRQVVGRCPISGCKSEKAYADECELGHQFSPDELIAPVSVTTGKTPSLIAVKNWYFDLERYAKQLKERQKFLREEGITRKPTLTVIDEFLRDPAILIKTEDFDALKEAAAEMPSHILEINEAQKSAAITFKELKKREEACEVLKKKGIRFRTGTTLVPFRLSGNVKWGIPVPEKDFVADRTFWVWPESLWAPMSFVKTYLQQTGSANNWEDWWWGDDSHVYQFIGEDNIYFYAVAEMGLFMALREIEGLEPEKNLPTIISNRHVFYGNTNKKASSSAEVKPPTAMELLDHYTVEQLRMHFSHMALQSNSAKFIPKAILTGLTGFDATLAEGNILTNVYNRLVRSCFYTMQKYYEGRLPDGEVGIDTQRLSDEMINGYEWAMYRFEFSKVIDLLDVYLREANKVWAANAKEADAGGDDALRRQTLTDTFHVVRVAATLLHPFAPWGTETVREYLGVDERLWSWDYIDKPLRFFIEEGHAFKFLEPRIDFFSKHEAQLGKQG
jgi:methionyl-tRNA synthetase